MRVLTALFLLIGVAAAVRKPHLRAHPTARPAEEAEQDVDESNTDTDVPVDADSEVPVEVEQTDADLPTENDDQVPVTDDAVDEVDKEHDELVEELKKSTQLKKALKHNSKSEQQFHEQEQQSKKLESRLVAEQRSAGSLMDELNKVGHKTEDVRKKLKKTESMFDAEQRKNGELMDELRAEQWKAMRAEQNRVSKDHDSMAEELKKTKKELEQARAHEAELEKKVTDLTHAKDLWKNAAESARKVIKDSQAAKASRNPKSSKIDHATLGKAVEMAHASETTSTKALKHKKVHKEVEEKLVGQESVETSAPVAPKKSEHAEKPVVKVADDSETEYDEDDISIISEADDKPLDEVDASAPSKDAAPQTTSTATVPAVQAKSDADADEEDDFDEEE